MGCISSKHSVSPPSLASSSPDIIQHQTSDSPVWHFGEVSASSASGYLLGPSASPLPFYEQGLIGAARWPDDAPGLNLSNRSETPENRAYCQSMYKAIRSAGQDIATGKIRSFGELWNKATEWRCSRIDTGDVHYPDFTSERESDTRCVTLIRNPYQSVYNRVLTHEDSKDEAFNDHLLGTFDVKVYRQTGNLHGHVIPLNTFSVANSRFIHDRISQLRREAGREVVNNHLKSNHPDRIEHTDVSYLPMIKNHLDELYSQVTAPGLSRGEVINTISRIHWWAASAVLNKRGSAAMSEFTARAIGCAHGIEFPPFRHGKVPDIEAMLIQEEQFVSSYRNLFERNFS